MSTINDITLEIVHSTTRDQAKKLGHKFYFTSRPCKSGHISNRRAVDGKCVDCLSAFYKRRYSRKKEEILQNRKSYYRDNREAILLYREKYVCENADRLREFRKKKYSENRDQEILKSRLRRKEDPEKGKLLCRSYYARNKHQARQRERDWKEKNPEKYRDIRISVSMRRRSRISNSSGNFTSAELTNLWGKVPHKCAVCSSAITPKTRHVDHIMPIALGGSNDIKNIQFLCAPCNQSKSCKHPIDFMQSRGLLI